MSTPLFGLASEQFVLLTTFRRTGEAVSTPVWVAPDGDLLVTTDPASGKVKRLRHTATVRLTACSMSGAVAAGAEPVAALAAVHSDAETLAALDRALERKYGLRYRAIRAGQRLRGTAGKSVAVVVTAAPVETQSQTESQTPTEAPAQS